MVALLHSYIRTNAAAFDRVPISQAARNLRVILFYMGFAWGAGAFLAVPPDLPALQAILFAVVPALLLALLLNDVDGACRLSGPAGVLTIGAAFVRSWPDAGLDALLILILQWGLFAAIALRRRIPSSRGSRLALNSCGGNCRGSIIGTD